MQEDTVIFPIGFLEFIYRGYRLVDIVTKVCIGSWLSVLHRFGSLCGNFVVVQCVECLFCSTEAYDLL